MGNISSTFAETVWSQDDCPLASLPLLGYAVQMPTDQDGIRKNHVFKLQFRNHVYFFRADSEFSFARWELVVNSIKVVVGPDLQKALSWWYDVVNLLPVFLLIKIHRLWWK